MSEFSDDLDIVELSPYHFRINGSIDVWPSSMKYKYRSEVMEYNNLRKFLLAVKNKELKL